MIWLWFFFFYLMQKEADELNQRLLNDQWNICILKFGLLYDVLNSEAQSWVLNETWRNNFYLLLTSH